MSQDDNLPYWAYDLPDDPIFLKECIQHQAELLGTQLLELHILRDQCRTIRRKNKALQELIWPHN